MNHKKINPSFSKYSEGKKDKPVKKNLLDISLDKLDSPGEVSWYYGFTKIKSPKITRDDALIARHFKEKIKYPETGGLTIDPGEVVSVLRTYMEYNMHNLPQPIMLSYNKPLGSDGKKTHREREFSLQILGPSRGTTEAVIIKTVLAILEEGGFPETYVELNCMGDRESATRFEHELKNHYLKNINDLPATLRQLFKKDIFEIERCEDPRVNDFVKSAPQPMSFLSDISREHFKVILEALEGLGIPYRMAGGLVGSHDFFPQTMFAVREGSLAIGNGAVLALGARMNYLARKVGMKREIQSVSATIRLKKAHTTKTKKIPKPKFYFIQLGPEAKLKSLEVIDALRKARVPVCHSITKDKIVGQLSTAESMKIPYILIMGQKETHENTVLVRNTTTRAQETISIAELPERLKKFK